MHACSLYGGGRAAQGQSRWAERCRGGVVGATCLAVSCACVRILYAAPSGSTGQGLWRHKGWRLASPRGHPEGAADEEGRRRRHQVLLQYAGHQPVDVQGQRAVDGACSWSAGRRAGRRRVNLAERGSTQLGVAHTPVQPAALPAGGGRGLRSAPQPSTRTPLNTAHPPAQPGTC